MSPIDKGEGRRNPRRTTNGKQSIYSEKERWDQIERGSSATLTGDNTTAALAPGTVSTPKSTKKPGQPSGVPAGRLNAVDFLTGSSVSVEAESEIVSEPAAQHDRRASDVGRSIETAVKSKGVTQPQPTSQASNSSSEHSSPRNIPQRGLKSAAAAAAAAAAISTPKPNPALVHPGNRAAGAQVAALSREPVKASVNAVSEPEKPSPPAEDFFTRAASLLSAERQPRMNMGLINRKRDDDAGIPIQEQVSSSTGNARRQRGQSGARSGKEQLASEAPRLQTQRLQAEPAISNVKSAKQQQQEQQQQKQQTPQPAHPPLLQEPALPPTNPATDKTTPNDIAPTTAPASGTSQSKPAAPKPAEPRAEPAATDKLSLEELSKAWARRKMDEERKRGEKRKRKNRDAAGKKKQKIEADMMAIMRASLAEVDDETSAMDAEVDAVTAAKVQKVQEDHERDLADLRENSDEGR